MNHPGTEQHPEPAPDVRGTLAATGLLTAVALGIFLAATLAYARWGGVLLAEVNSRVGETELQHALDLHRGGFLEEAEIAYRDALEVDWSGEQNRAFALKELGALLVTQDRFVDAAAVLRLAVHSSRTPITTYEKLVLALLALDESSEAMETVRTWQEAAESEGNALEQTLAHYHHGKLALAQGDPARARAQFETGHALLPGRGNALELARFAHEEAAHPEALALLDSFFLTGPREPLLSDGLALRAQVLAQYAP